VNISLPLLFNPTLALHHYLQRVHQKNGHKAMASRGQPFDAAFAIEALKIGFTATSMRKRSIIKKRIPNISAPVVVRIFQAKVP
jgi:hypothetical protein